MIIDCHCVAMVVVVIGSMVTELKKKIKIKKTQQHIIIRWKTCNNTNKDYKSKNEFPFQQ